MNDKLALAAKSDAEGRSAWRLNNRPIRTKEYILLAAIDLHRGA
jgi:hypothetical protein